MVIHDSGNRQSPIKRANLRTCCFYLDWLGLNEAIRTNNVNRQDGEICRQAVNKLINQYYPNKEQQSQLLTKMDESYEENILPTACFDWLNQDERAAFWMWACLCKNSDYNTGIYPPANPEPGQNWYQRLQLSFSPASHKERMSLIFSFFDLVIIPTPPVSHIKKKLMERLKDQWKIIYSKQLPLKWLPDNEEAVLWAWNSLQKLQIEKNQKSDRYGFDFFTPGLTTWFTPLSNTERCLALRAALDLWDNAPDTKRLFLLNLNKAWNQQKLRQSRTDKKALNTYLKNETKNNLDFMAEHSELRISDMLEKLINDHYRKTFVDE